MKFIYVAPFLLVILKIRTLSACYAFPPNMKDPCAGKKCSFGAKCVSSLDGLSARCQCPEVCYNFGDSEGNTPLCGTDGKDYPNVCKMEQTSCREMKNVQKKYDGLCDPCKHFKCPEQQVCRLTPRRQPSCHCPRKCPDIYQPVCASDGTTYVNQCSMEMHACRFSKVLRVISKGNCSADNPCSHATKCEHHAECSLDDYERASCECVFSCQRVADPVCGSDGATYDSVCELKRQSCLRKQLIRVLKEGICDDVFMKSEASSDSARGSCENHECWHGAKCVEGEVGPSCVCEQCPDQSASPVCASNKRTYNSECHLKNFNCLNKKKIFVIHAGVCETVKDCEWSKFGCCSQGGYSAQGPAKQGCPEVCQCNQHGSVGPLCDPVSLKCTCKEGVTGSKCDRCALNYWAFHKIREGYDGCKACKCNVVGSLRADCDQTNGSCTCRKAFSGSKCQFCPDGKPVKKHSCSQNKGQAQGDDVRCIEEVTCKYGGKCKKVGEKVECVCPASCLPSTRQVCGSDHSTYHSLCHLQQSACRLQRDLHVLHEGACVLGHTTIKRRAVKFGGKSFYSFRNSNKNATHFTLNGVFSIMGKDGVLFLETENYKSSSDFFGVFVRAGRVGVIYNLGDESSKKLPTMLSKRRVDDGRMHELTITRSKRHVEMILDKDDPMHISSTPGSSELTTSDLFTIGGSKKRMKVACGSRCRNDLVGCILRLQINGATVNFEEALSTKVHYCTD